MAQAQEDEDEPEDGAACAAKELQWRPQRKSKGPTYHLQDEMTFKKASTWSIYTSVCIHICIYVYRQTDVNLHTGLPIAFGMWPQLYNEKDVSTYIRVGLPLVPQEIRHSVAAALAGTRKVLWREGLSTLSIHLSHGQNSLHAA